MEYRWCSFPDSEPVMEQLCSELRISPLVAKLLVHRGITNPEWGQAFLNPHLDELHDPFKMAGMQEAVARISRALDQGEKILVYGDYDVDGITSTVVLRRALEMLGGEVRYHIPRRLEDGYGLKNPVLEEAFREGCRLVITVDSGIRDFESCRFARELGLDLIVTDHHLPADELPDAYVVLNPKRPDCLYPDKNLAAVGVVFKLVQALFETSGRSRVIPHFLKIVAIGTIADMVPLTGENRIFVFHGLAGLSKPYNLGLQALLNGSGVAGTVDPFDVGFKLAPRINAFTRMGGSKEVVDLFSVDDRDLADHIVDEMNDRNVQRRAEEDRILTEIDTMVEADPSLVQSSFILLAGPDWHRGVIGNVAARIVERYYRPTLVISVADDVAQGSGRSIPGFHLLKALEHSPGFFDRFGGHAQAVGCTLKANLCDAGSIAELAEQLKEYAGRQLSKEQLVPRLMIDSYLSPDQLSLDLYHDVNRLAPFGMGNPVPMFACTQMGVAAGPWLLKERHLKLRTQGNGQLVDLIWWRKGEMAPLLKPDRPFDAAFHLTMDTYGGVEKLLLTAKDMRIP